MANDELFKLTWNGHSGAFLTIFESLRSKAKYTDVTLACEGKLFAVHRLVLASCSQFFDSIFDQTPAENTVIVLNEAKQQDIQALIDYMYSGQVEVPHSQLTSFLNTAGSLQIKGLTREENGLGQRIVISDQKEFADNVPPLKKRKSEVNLNSDTKIPNKSSNVSNLSSIVKKRHESATTSVCHSSMDVIPESWQQFQRSDLPNTTWSSHASKERNDISEPRSKDFDIRSPNKTLNSNELLLRSTVEKALHRVPETGAITLFHSIKEESRKLNTSNDDEEHVMNYSTETLDYPKNIKNEYGELIINEPNAESDYVTSPEIYDHYNNYADTFDSHNVHSPNISPHPTQHHSTSATMKYTSDQNVSNNSTVNPKLMPFAKCSNCLTSNTKLWRRNMKGEIVCNACGLYFKLHGINRPSHLFRNAPMTRRRHPRKKKKSYEEILEAREQSTSDDPNESYYNEGGCDSDTAQDSLAVLNAALTLNSLFAKAKQEAATNFISGSSRFDSPNSSPVPIDSSSNANTDGGRPPPALLKLPMRPPANPLTTSSQDLSIHVSQD